MSARPSTAPENGRAEGEVAVKLGPITSAFSGVVDIDRDDANYRAVVHGAGRDAKSASRARAIITYQVDAVEDDRSRVAVSVKFLLAGAPAADAATTLDASTIARAAFWDRITAFFRRLFGR